MIPVANLERAVAFYRDRLGLAFLFLASPHVVHRTPTGELWLAEFTDPDGNQLALMSEVAGRATG
jgi:predicted enzyme related to lactoylglutathione lyase